MNDNLNIKIYTIPECPYCTKLKNGLNDKNIPFNEVDVSLSENEKEFDNVMKVSGTDLVPTITVGRNLLAPNVNFKTIDEAINLIEYILNNEEI